MKIETVLLAFVVAEEGKLKMILRVNWRQRYTIIRKLQYLNLAATCLNDAWTIDDSGSCVPKQENFKLHCGSNGIDIELSNKLIPNAKEVKLGNCAAVLDVNS